jgi:hypothetical protein
MCIASPFSGRGSSLLLFLSLFIPSGVSPDFKRLRGLGSLKNPDTSYKLFDALWPDCQIYGGQGNHICSLSSILGHSSCFKVSSRHCLSEWETFRVCSSIQSLEFHTPDVLSLHTFSGLMIVKNIDCKRIRLLRFHISQKNYEKYGNVLDDRSVVGCLRRQ